MTKKLNILTGAYMLFLVLLHLSALLDGPLSEAAYYLAFILPVAICLWTTRGDELKWKEHFRIDIDDIKLVAPIVFPTISSIMLVSYVTSVVIFALTGRTNSVEIGDSYLLAIITHALLPAILEEALFRYVPMRLLAPHSPRYAIIVSAVFFALVHQDLFTIPYALLAGFIFMSLDLATDSVIPSLIIHFLNNALSVSLMFISYEGTFIIVLLWLFMVTIASIALIVKNREEYEIPLMMIFDKGEGMRLTPQMVFFALFTLAIAVLNLL